MLAVSCVCVYARDACALKFYCPGKMACDRGEDTRMLSQIRSEPGGKDT